MAEPAREEIQAKNRTAPPSREVYEAIREEALEELGRPSSALFWSALAAGLSMGLSLIAEGVLRAHLPQEPWMPLVTKLGYPAGFLAVILGRQQLFTENTVKPILPLMNRGTPTVIKDVARLWAVVLAGNLIGAALVATYISLTASFEPYIQMSFAEIGREAMRDSFSGHLLSGVIAGWMIALMVWLLPYAESARFWVVLFMAYFVGLGGLSHVIAGSVEVFVLAATGEQSWLNALFAFTLPTFLGNALGGVTLVAALNHAQVVSGEDGSRR